MSIDTANSLLFSNMSV